MKTDLRCIDGAAVRQGEQVDLGQDDGEGDAEGPLDHGCRRAVDAGCIGIGHEKTSQTTVRSPEIPLLQ